MKTLLLLLTLISYPALCWADVLGTDDFNRTNGGLGSTWTVVPGLEEPQIVSNHVQPKTINLATIALFTSVTWPADQYAYTKVLALNSANNRIGGIFLRGSTSVFDGYLIYFKGPLGAGSKLAINRYNGGTPTTILADTTKTLNAGQVVRAQIETIGTTAVIRVFYDDIDQVGPIVDTSPISSGRPGIYAYTGAGALTDVQEDDWGGGSLRSFAAIRSPASARSAASPRTSLSTPRCMRVTHIDQILLDARGQEVLDAQGCPIYIN